MTKTKSPAPPARTRAAANRSRISEDFDDARIVEHGDGFYWQDKGDGKEYGPFASLADALEDMRGGNADAESQGETLHEVEEEFGISDWIDPDSGMPAEHFVPHLEDH